MPRKPSVAQKNFGQARIIQSIEPFNGRAAALKQQSLGQAANNYHDGHSRPGPRKVGANLAAQRYGAQGDPRNFAPGKP